MTCSYIDGKVMVQNKKHCGLTWCSAQIVNEITLLIFLKYVRTVKINPAVLGRFGMGVLMNVPSTNVWRMGGLFLSSLSVKKSPPPFVNEKLKLSWALLMSWPVVLKKSVVCEWTGAFVDMHSNQSENTAG